MEHTRERADMAEGRAALIRRAADLIGSERLARELGVAPRTVYWWMSGQRTVKDSILAEVRQLLIGQRQAIGDLLQAIRDEEAATAPETGAPSADQVKAARAATRQFLARPRGERP